MSSLSYLIQACRVVWRFRRRIIGGRWYLVTSRFDCQERWTQREPDIHTMVLDQEGSTTKLLNRPSSRRGILPTLASTRQIRALPGICHSEILSGQSGRLDTILTSRSATGSVLLVSSGRDR